MLVFALVYKVLKMLKHWESLWLFVVINNK